MSENQPIIRLLLLSAGATCASVCLRIDASGRVLSRQRVDGAQPLPTEKNARDVLAVPSAGLRLLWLDIPAHSPAQALAAARLLLQEHAAGTRAELHIAIAEAAAGSALRLVGVVGNDVMHEWLQRARQLGLAASSVVPDCLLLDAPQDEDGPVQVCERDGLWLVRGTRLAFATEPALAACILGPQPLQQLDTSASEARFAANATLPPLLELLQYAHARRDEKTPRRHKRLRRLAIAALLSPLLFTAAQAAYHDLSARWLQHRADTLAVQHVPALAAAAAPARALHAHYRQHIAAGVLAFHSTKLFEALQAVPGTQLDSCEFATDTGLRAGLLHGSETELDALREQLAGSGLDLVPLDKQPLEHGLRTLIQVEPLR
ncbi:MAG: type II secretion system protein GspL [Stenotrophomonas sp.]